MDINNGLRKDLLNKQKAVDKSSNMSQKVQKTESFLDLTRPSLDGIYNNNSYSDLEKENEEINEFIGESNEYVIPGRRPSTASEDFSPDQKKAKIHGVIYILLSTVLKILLMAISAFIYNMITKEIHNSHIMVSRHTYGPLLVTNMYLTRFLTNLRPFTSASSELAVFADQLFALAFQGSIMGLMHPILDRILPRIMSKRLFSSNPNPTSQDFSSLLSDLIRCAMTFFGISYAIRKIEWNASLQVSIIWSLLNPSLWLLLDGTVSGLLSGSLVAGLACFTVHLQNHGNNAFNSLDFIRSEKGEDSIAMWLWVGSFFFCGAILFGKLGRALFQ